MRKILLVQKASKTAVKEDGQPTEVHFTEALEVVGDMAIHMVQWFVFIIFFNYCYVNNF